MASERREAADLIRSVLTGELAPAQAESRWPANKSEDRSLHAAMHALQHYRIDAGKRMNDPRYAESQTVQLRDIADSLAADQDVDAAVLDALEPRTGCLFNLMGG